MCISGEFIIGHLVFMFRHATLTDRHLSCKSFPLTYKEIIVTHKHEDEDDFLRLELTALAFTLRIWQSAMKQERSQQVKMKENYLII